VVDVVMLYQTNCGGCGNNPVGYGRCNSKVECDGCGNTSLGGLCGGCNKSGGLCDGYCNTQGGLCDG
jgi:hypothetical protein